jgi:glycosyltransferase involved in cell wall biosynthesis
MNKITPDQLLELKQSLTKLSVVMPAFNEANVIFESVLTSADTLEGCDFEIIVVDDGSSDETYAEAIRAADVIENRRTTGHVIVIRNEPNHGKGHALKSGFAHATGDLVAFLDADLDLHPSQLWSLWGVMLQSGADVVIGSKHHPESKLIYPWYRRVLSRSYFALITLLFGLPLEDTQTGIKIFRREVLEKVLPRMKVQRFAYDLELLVGADRFGYRIAEAPVELTFQGGKMGLMGLGSASLNIWLDTLQVYIRASFWHWLQPSLTTRIWLVAFVLGLVAASFGMANWLTLLSVPTWIHNLGYYMTLKFIPHDLRNFLLIAGGMIVSVVALVQLNKHLMRAFAHADDGDIAGISRNRQNE